MSTLEHPLDRPLDRQVRSDRTARLLDRAHLLPDGVERDDVLNDVVLLNRGVAEAVAARFRDRGVPMDDLQQTAYVGLLKAVRRFDPSRSEDLLTFAVPTIRGELQRYFRDHGWAVRPPRRVQALRVQVSRCTEVLTQVLGREPSREELVAELGVTRAEFDDCTQAIGCLRPVSLDLGVTADSDTALVDLMIDPDEGDDSQEERSARRVVVADLMRELTTRERRILYLRFACDRTQAEIGAEIGVTQMQVSRLLSSILGRMRARAAAAEIER